MQVSRGGRLHFLPWGGIAVTREETSARYHIPLPVLEEYERWGLRGAGERGYDAADLERLSTILTLHDVGFTAEEAETYMRLLEEDDTAAQRLQMLEEKRSAALEEIHRKECQLQRLDYLRHEIRKTQGGNAI